MADNRIQTRVSERLVEWLLDRANRLGSGGSIHMQAGHDLDMLRALLARELGRIRLTVNEANCVADILNGTMLSAGEMAAFPAVATDVAEAFQLAREEAFPGEVSYGEKWGIDEDRLVSYLRALGASADHALADAISRWWAADDHAGTVEGWARVGLRVREPEGK